ncbi:hypothetical protein AB0F17_34740 [Nonomuraea sp. NPDC026600]|uniref:hypothetical protein n=1 Tax=Nonomuraea sp. NPDC026600 TaxID=3155363 RepID=UPI0033ECD59C
MGTNALEARSESFHLHNTVGRPMREELSGWSFPLDDVPYVQAALEQIVDWLFSTGYTVEGGELPCDAAVSGDRVVVSPLQGLVYGGGQPDAATVELL